MSIPQVAIVGRPNVGKSSLFNWLAGRRLAIVDDVAGVTRDRMNHLLFEQERYFEIIDTGGIGINDVDNLTTEIEEQIAYGIAAADLLVFVVDARDGITQLDLRVNQRLRDANKRTILVANKCDNDRMEAEANEFYSLGFDEVIVVSAKNNRHKQDLLDGIVASLPEPSGDDESFESPELKIAIVGRRNVGKSTFINTLTDSRRLIVSEVAGTTRDSVDVRFEMDGKTYVAIDTPGLRRNKSVRTDIEFYSTHRAKRTIRHADVVLMFFDASKRLSKVDKQLCSYIEEEFKPCLLVVNKWDLMAEHMPTEQWTEYLRENFPSLWHVPIAFVTGQTGKNAKRLLNHAQMLAKQSAERVSTGELNRLIRRALEHHPPPLSKQRRRPKIYYATQVATRPPTIVFMCNDPDSFPPTYQRYLRSVLNDQLQFGEVPIKMFLQRRAQTDKKNLLEERRTKK